MLEIAGREAIGLNTCQHQFASEELAVWEVGELRLFDRPCGCALMRTEGKSHEDADEMDLIDPS